MMKWTPEMTEAAKLLGLDPNDDRHRKLLLACVRAAGKRRGRPKGSVHWTHDKLISLGRIAEDLSIDPVKRRVIRWSDRKLAKLIFKRSPREFRSVEAIRRHLPEALICYEMWWSEYIHNLEPPDDWNEGHSDQDWDD
jgi:hypothetical protein